MKLLYIYGYPFFNLESSEGPAIHINSTIRAFREAGWEVTPFVGSKINKVVGRSSRSLSSPSFVSKIRKTLIDLAELAYGVVQFLKVVGSTRKPDLIFERYSLFSWIGLALKRTWKIPYFAEFNDTGIETRNKYFGRTYLEPISNIILNRIISETSAIIAVSRPVASKLALRGANAKKIYTIPNGVSPDFFLPEGHDRQRIRHNLDLQDEIVIGFVGGIAPWHGVNFLIEAACQIVRIQSNVKFLIVGGGESSISQITDLARGHGIAEHVICTGWVNHEQIASYLAAMDIVTAPYALMGNDPVYFSPLKVFEYMAMGKPVVASRIDQLVEIFEDGKEIILIEPENVEELGGAISRLISDPALAKELGSNARKKVLHTYTWEKTVASVLEIYSNLE